MNFSINIWKIRSALYHDTHVPQTELTIRQEAYSLLLQIQTSPDRLPAANRNLLNRRRRFLFKSSPRQIQAWVGHVNTAVSVKQRIDEKSKRDIRNFLYRVFKSTNFQNDNPDYDTDAMDNFLTHYPDEDRELDSWDIYKNLNQSHVNENSLPEIKNSNSISDLVFSHRGSKYRA